MPIAARGSEVTCWVSALARADKSASVDPETQDDDLKVVYAVPPQPA